MHERILAIDYGRARHGLAVSDGLGLAAHPLACLERHKDPARDLIALRKVCEERDVRRLVVGLPLNMDDSEGPMAKEARRFGDALAAELGLPVAYEDERLSSDEAEHVLRERGFKPGERRKRVDSMAAVVILQAVLQREG